MHAVTICLVLLLLAAIAALLARASRLPLPIVQIAIGVAAALPPLGLSAPLEPDTFLLLFLPPLLFADGWTLPQRALYALRWPVLGLAVGLVLLTVLAGGYGLRWLVPDMPLSVAFALAALVSPTDAVAVSAITARLTVPRRMMHLLESEALLNDATGLTAMRFAVAATLSGSFSPAHAALSFILVAAGGLAIGAAVTFLYARLHRALLTGEDDGAVQTVLLGLLPFAVYALAERAELSGILAAVGAGMTASRVGLLEAAHFSSRLQTKFAWDVIGVCLNGVIFVLLGMQLPGIVGNGPAGIDLIRSQTRLTILGDIGALMALLIGVRLLWVLVSLLLRHMFGGAMGRPEWRVIAATSLGGVRGAVTLAGALSLPLSLPDGTRFPGRDLAVTLATGVILLSLLIAAAALPLLLRRVADGSAEERDELRLARGAGLRAALDAVGDEASDGRAAALAGAYRQRLERLGADDEDEQAWQALHRRTLHAERQAVRALRHAGRVDDAVARRVLGELDVIEAAAMHRPGALPLDPAGGRASRPPSV